MHDGGAVGHAEAVARHVGGKRRQLGKGRDVLLQLNAHFLPCGFTHRAAKKSLGVEVAGDQFQVQFHKGDQLAHFGGRERLGGDEGRSGVGGLDVVSNHRGFAQRALRGEQIGHLAQG